VEKLPENYKLSTTVIGGNIFAFYLHLDDQAEINIRPFQEQQIAKDVLHY